MGDRSTARPPARVAELSAFARLPLPDERHDIVGAALDSVYGEIDRLRELELGDTPTATAFDARWR
ncbi:hypothetical protein [Nocardia farcinica]|uniref:hypothetical protein n=1 Tax=Nocardia farcinica TaxID=37329 RepID=UPI002456C1C5|nr:hypothetical protein [Nocardia farcinica]